ncbi:MAG: STAS domain-containing protein, partial [Verrucomicrobiota bacterium]|nr:STAS domain-containing protein [Verrucomicrobiota bacterium]
VRTLLAAMKLDRLLPMAASDEEAQRIFQSRAAKMDAVMASENDRLVLRPAGELTAATSVEFGAVLQERWARNSAASLLQVDLSDIRFIDSTGLGCLLRARKFAAARAGARLRITGANENVRNVIALARLNEILDARK